MIARYVQHEQNRRIAEKKTVVWAVMLTLFGALPDYSALCVLYGEGSRYASPMVVILLISMAFQALSAVVFKALGIIVHAFGGKAALPCARSGIHEEFVILLTKFSANVGAVSAAFAALVKMVEPEVVSEDIPDDEVTDP
jgi:hypothetical protein